MSLCFHSEGPCVCTSSPSFSSSSSKDKSKVVMASENKEAPQVADAAAAAPAAGGKKDKKKGGAASAEAELSPQPDFIAHRIALFDKIKAKHVEEIAAKEHKDITITLRDGKVLSGKAFETTPLSIAEGISKSLAGKVVVAKVNAQLWDLVRPFEEDSRLELLDFDDPEAQMVYWHSSAHMLGEACERCFGVHLEHGPPTEDGFFYDMRLPADFKGTVNEELYPALVSTANKIAGEKQNFERLSMTKEELLEMFKYNNLKTYFINSKIADGASSTVYRCGPLIDLCMGPHITNTSRVKAFTIYKNSQAYWLGDAKNEQLTRIYGISFPENKLLTEWEKFREEAAKRDHRLLGRQHELFFFHELSPGSCFFLPHGTRIYNTLIQFMRSHYWERGFQEVITPNMYNTKLWERSGHWQNYQENMFSFEVEKEKFALKPMNCPGHCLAFDLRPRSHRELPLRMADFGVLHRNEYSGALTGLTRVRRFQQDDAHIFCMKEQVGDEIRGALDFLKHVYGVLGFNLSMALSTRPDKFIGEVATWDAAEAQLKAALNESGFDWKLNPGDGAFYGPKIDIQIQDAMRRRHQCATIQLDFQLPERFDLKYQAPDGTDARPVMIHRAILGSVERMIAVLTENYAAKWPFWLSPRQICIVPVAAPFNEYAAKLKKQFHDAGFFVDLDDGPDTLNKKVRNAQVAFYNFIFVVGEKEQEKNEVNVRTRDNVVHGSVSIEHALEQLALLKTSYARTDEFK